MSKAHKISNLHVNKELWPKQYNLEICTTVGLKHFIKVTSNKKAIGTWFNCLRDSFDVWSSATTRTSFIAHICPFSLLILTKYRSWQPYDYVNNFINRNPIMIIFKYLDIQVYAVIFINESIMIILFPTENTSKVPSFVPWIKESN